MTPKPQGLINGKRFVNRRYVREEKAILPEKRPPIRPMLFGSAIVALLVLIVFAPYVATPSEDQRMRMDGDFSDWFGIGDFGGWKEREAHIWHDYTFETPTAGRAGKMDAFRMWLDTDRDSNTGLLVRGIGADLRLVLQMWQGRVKDASLCVWQPSVAWDYSSFGGCTGIGAEAGSDAVEFRLASWVIGRPSWVADSLPAGVPIGGRTWQYGASTSWTEPAASLVWRDYIQASGMIEEWPWLISENVTQSYPSNTTLAGRLKVENVTALLSPWNTSLLLDLRADPLPIPFRFSAPPSGKPPIKSEAPPGTGGTRKTIPDRRDRLTLAASDRNESMTAYLWQGRVMARRAENVTAYAAGRMDALEVQVLSSWDSGTIVTLRPSEDRTADYSFESQDSFYAPTHVLSAPLPEPLDITGNTIFWFRNTAHGSETDCTGTNDKVGSQTQGAGAMQTISLTTGQNACWYLDATTGKIIYAGDWETLLDVQTTGDNGGSGDAWGVAAYRSNTGSCTTADVNCPKVSYFISGIWTLEYELPTAGGGVENVRVEWDPAMSYVHYIAVNAGATITVYRCTDLDGSTCSSLGTATTAANSAPERRWDIALEQSSGVGLLLYDGDVAVAASDLCYRTFSTSLSGETCFDHSWINSTNPAFAWVDLVSNPGTDSIAFAAFDTTNDDTLLGMWDGSAILTGDDMRACTLAGTLTTGMNAEVAFEDSANEFVAYCGDGASNMNECEWTSAAGWEYDNGGTVTCGAFDPNPSANNDVRTMGCASQLGTNDAVCGQNDDTNDIDVWRWVGVSGAGGAQDFAFEPSFSDIGTINRDFDFAWDPQDDDDYDAGVFHWDGTDSRCEAKFLDDAGVFGWTATITFDTCTASASNWFRSVGSPWSTDATAAMLLRSAANFDIYAHQWTGCSTGCVDNEQTLTSDTVNQNYFHMDFAWGPRSVEYDVRLEVWDMPTNTVKTTIGTCIDVVTRGDDIQCLISGVAQQTLDADDVVRIKIAHSSAAGTVKIDYDDADSTGDSRATIPLPEFELVGGLSVVSIVLVAAWIRRRRSA